MLPKRFLSLLTIITFATILVFIALHQLSAFAPHQRFSWISIGFFFVLSVVMYFSALRASQSSNKYHFNSIVIGFIFFKMVLSVALVLIYAKKFQPTDKWFLASFFINYLIYTIFETGFMMKLAHFKSKKS